MQKIKSWRVEIICVLLLLLCIFFGTKISPSISDVKLIQKDSESAESLPISEEVGDNQNFQVSMHYSPGIFSKAIWKITPDDCLNKIKVGTQIFYTDTIPGHCNYVNGFSISSADFLREKQEEETDLTFFLKNNGGPGGISIALQSASVFFFGYLTITFFIFGVLLFCLLHRFKIPTPFAFAIVIATLLHGIYALNTPHTVRAHDVEGHVNYIKYVAEELKIPADNDCWTCYQPPVYYTAMAPIWTIANFSHIDSTKAIQWASVILSFLLMTFGFVCFRSFLTGKILWAATLLWLFCPIGFLIAPRIGNDQFFFAAHALTLMGVMLYANNKSSKFLLLAAISCWISFWSKSTGSVTVAIWCIGFVVGYVTRDSWKMKKSEYAAIIIMLFLFAGMILRLFFGKEIVGNAESLHSGLAISAAPINLLVFDVLDFLKTTYTSAWNDEGGRQFFINYMAKTSLFGEFTLTRTPFGIWCATLLNLSAFVLAIYAFVGFWKHKFSKATLILTAQGILFFAAMAFLRIKIPYACSSDFRYVMPMLLSFIPFVSMGIFKENSSTKWKNLGVAMTIIFCVSSVLLMLSL